jgi:type II secretory pathway pseudopilin PulG
MAALLVALAVMAVLLTVAMPVWKTAVKREKEAELVWRASQYVRAILLFRRKYANASPPNLDILVNERFLRKKYKDPMTEDGEFQLVYASDQQQRPGQPSGQNPAGQPPGAQTPAAPPPSLDPRNRGAAGAGGIVGVASKSKEPSLRIFNGRSKYNEWVFTPETLGIRMQGTGNTPANVPGGAAGAVGPDGRPLAPQGRRQIGFDRSGRVTPQQPGSSGPSPTQQPRFGLPQKPPQ